MIAYSTWCQIHDLQRRELTSGPETRLDRSELFCSRVLCCVLCLVTQPCLTLCDPTDCSPPGSSVHGDSPGKKTGVGCHALLHGIFSNPGIELRSPTLHANIFFLPSEPLGKPQNTGVGSLSLLQGIFLTQELSQGLPHCRQILYQLS